MSRGCLHQRLSELQGIIQNQGDAINLPSSRYQQTSLMAIIVKQKNCLLAKSVWSQKLTFVLLLQDLYKATRNGMAYRICHN